MECWRNLIDRADRVLVERLSRGSVEGSGLRSACERQFEIIGEAMTRLRDLHPDVSEQVTDGHAIIAFRNRLIHGYDTVDAQIVWDVIQTRIPDLERVVGGLLEDSG